jgi:hypothetical protein
MNLNLLFLKEFWKKHAEYLLNVIFSKGVEWLIKKLN